MSILRDYYHASQELGLLLKNQRSIPVKFYWRYSDIAGGSVLGRMLLLNELLPEMLTALAITTRLDDEDDRLKTVIEMTLAATDSAKANSSVGLVALDRLTFSTGYFFDYVGRPELHPIDVVLAIIEGELSYSEGLELISVAFDEAAEIEGSDLFVDAHVEVMSLSLMNEIERVS